MSLSNDIIEGYLLSIRTSWWGGRGWDISDDEERLEAVEWLQGTIRAIQEFAETDGKEQIEGTPLRRAAWDAYLARAKAAVVELHGPSSREELNRAMGLTFPPPARGTHESGLYDRWEIDWFGPPIGSLPGTGSDGYWARAAHWSAS